MSQPKIESKQDIPKKFDDYINKHNSDYERGLHTFQISHNKFSHYSPNEFSRLFKGFDSTQHSRKHDSSKFSLKINESNNSLPDAVDWRQKGCVNAVVDQGQCGCCYAFASCAAIEGQYAKANGKLIKLSGISIFLNMIKKV